MVGFIRHTLSKVRQWQTVINPETSPDLLIFSLIMTV